MNLKEFQKKYGIRRIDFSKVKSSRKDTEYGEDSLICPYCKKVIQYEMENTKTILLGTPWQCPECEKYFYADGEVTIDTTCTPIEDKVLEEWVQRNIEDGYEHMDTCDRAGCEWDNPFGVFEYEVYKEYAEPLFENEKLEKRYNEMKCDACDNNDKCLDRAKYDLVGCTSGIPGEVFTNFDRIRNMTDEEMAETISELDSGMGKEEWLERLRSEA